MKKIILPLVFILILALAVSAVCLYRHWDHEQNTQTLEQMKNYASEKYGQEFTVEYFLPARDSSYTNILTLSNGQYLFNVLHDTGSEDTYDDLPNVILNRILTDHIQDTAACNGTDFVLYGNFLLTGDKFHGYTYDQLDALSPQEILENYDILKVILIVKTPRSIPQQADELFALYQAVVALQPKILDFEVIHVKEESEALEKMLNNLTGYYSSHWKSYPVIKDCLKITDLEIQSPAQLLESNEYNQ